MQGNAKLTWEWVQCARGMQGNDGKYQGNAKGTYGSGCKVPGEWKGIPLECMVVVKSAREMQVNVREMYGSGCKLPGECMGVGAKYHG